MAAMRLLALALALLLVCSGLFAYKLTSTREDMLNYYYTSIESKIPTSARALVGDERINVFIGGKTLGIATKHGQLYSFEMAPVENPTITITVSDSAADAISRKKLGLLRAIENGGIRIETRSFFSALKVEMIKRLYAVSGGDAKFLSGADLPAATANSIYVQRVRIWN